MSDVMSATPQTVMITRPAGQAVELVAAIRAAGLLAVEFPLLEIRAVSDTSALHAALSALERYALVVFVSPNAIDQVMAYRDAIGVAWPKQVPLGVMGPGSVRALAQWGIAAPRYQVIAPQGAQAEVIVAPLDATHEVARDDAHELAAQTPASVPLSSPQPGVGPSAEPSAEPAIQLSRAEAQTPPASDESAQDPVRYDSEALLEALDQVFHLDTLAGREVLLVRGDGGREVFAETLRAMGVIVTTVTAYHRSAPQPTQAQWQALAAQLDQAPERLAWLFTSSEGVRYLNDLARTALNPAHYAALKRSQAIAPHARIAETARSLGFDTITLSGAGDRNIVNALLSWATPRATPQATPSAASLATSQTTQLVSRRMTDTHDTPLDPQSSTPATGAASASNPAATLPGLAEAKPQPGLSAAGAPPRDPLGNGNGPGPRPGSGPDSTPPTEPGAGQRAVPWIILLIVVLAAGGGAYALNRKLDRAEHALAQRQDASDARIAQVVAQAHELDSQFGQVSSKVQDTQSAEQALQQQYQDLARNRDDWTLAEIGQMLSTASEQLQLTGNVQLALFALQSADARLATSTGPQMLGVRRAIQQDIEKLKATPQVDLAGMAIKLDDAISQVDTLPLLGEEKNPDNAAGAAQPASADASAGASNNGWQSWSKQLLLEAGRDLKSLIQVRRIDDPDAMLVAPDQGYFLRANLKLRLLSARLSLLARNQATLKSDLNSANAALNRYFDPTSKRVQTVRNLLQQVDQQSANVALPDMNGSLAAVRQFKSRS